MRYAAATLVGIGIGYLMASTAASLVEDRPAMRAAGWLILWAGCVLAWIVA